MGALKQWKKYGCHTILAGIWDKEHMTMTISRNVYKVVKRVSKPYTYYEQEWEGTYADGDGGYLQGKGEKKTAVKDWYFCYDGNQVVGVINEYNVMFQSPDRYQVMMLDSINSKFALQPIEE